MPVFTKTFKVPSTIHLRDFTDEIVPGPWGWTFVGDSTYEFQAKTKKDLASAMRAAAGALRRLERVLRDREAKALRQEKRNEAMREYARASVARYRR